MGFSAYRIWQSDLLDEDWYDRSDDEQFARRFSVNQFCALALYDARKAAHAYLKSSASLLPGQEERMNRMAALFAVIAEKAEQIHRMLDSGEYLEGAKARAFWTKGLRQSQAQLLSQMLKAEQEAAFLAEGII